MPELEARLALSECFKELTTKGKVRAPWATQILHDSLPR
jgi:hypothetical protein